MFRAHLNAAGSDEPTNPPLVFLDQTLIVFDVEQRKNASQILHLKRMPKIGLVSYRFQTNAPTRYIVNPNCGILSDDNPIPIKIELVGNRFNPQHKLILQAALIENKDDWQRVWEDARTDKPGVYQNLWIELSTTVMNLEQAQNFNEHETLVSTLLKIKRVRMSSPTKPDYNKISQNASVAVGQLLNASNSKRSQVITRSRYKNYTEKHRANKQPERDY
ncbi:hypothetical protein COOONC_17318 [Cooperia oncophora]